MAAIRERWADHPTIDFGIAAVVFVVLAWGNLSSIIGLDELPRSGRASTYTSASMVIALLTGFGSVAIGAHTSGNGPRARLLREHFSGHLAANWRQVMSATALAAVVAWSAQLIDVNYGVRWAGAAVLTAIVLALITIARQLFLFLSLLRMNDRDQSEKTGPKRPVGYEPRTRTGHAVGSRDPQKLNL